MAEYIKFPISSIAEDQEGNPVTLSAVIDDEGKAVLRTVNAAPDAYDDEKDAIKVILLDDEDYISGNRVLQPFSEENVRSGRYIEYQGIVVTGKEVRLALRWENGSPNYKVTARYQASGGLYTLVKEETLIEADDGKNLADITFEPLTKIFDLRIYNEDEEDKELRVAELMFV